VCRGLRVPVVRCLHLAIVVVGPLGSACPGLRRLTPERPRPAAVMSRGRLPRHAAGPGTAGVGAALGVPLAAGETLPAGHAALAEERAATWGLSSAPALRPTPRMMSASAKGS
jgi:hypothetical protein